MADKKGDAKEGKAPIIKKIKKGHGHGHHGGAWKVAYADFVTAMMAFFLLMWLLNATSQEQRLGIANYFNPVTVTTVNISGSGGVLGGTTAGPDGALEKNSTTMSVSPSMTPPQDTADGPDADYPTSAREVAEDKKLDELIAKKEEEEFKRVEESLREKVNADVELSKLSENLLIERTPEGLRIQIIDQDKIEMFAVGSAQMFDYTQKILTKVAEVVRQLPNKIAISGHTDGRQYSPGATYTNWELSSDRANAARRALVQANIPESRIARVVGRADREHLIPNDPMDAKNRRLSIVILTETKAKNFEAMQQNPLGSSDSLFREPPKN
jgi:chemotaxis protein MotB